MTVRRIIIIVVIVALLAIAGFFGYRFLTGSQQAETGEQAQADIPPVTDVSGAVTAEGRLVPARNAELSFSVGGTVEEILVQEGDQVEAGDPLVRLDAAIQESTLNQAQAELAAAEARQQSAEAQLAAAQAGVTSAELGIQASEANLALVKAGALPEEIASAERNIDAAIAGVTQAAANREATLEVADSDIRTAEANVASARAEVKALQDAYDTIIDTCFSLPNGDEICPLYGTIEENTRRQLEIAKLQLDSAQAALDALNQGATPGQRQAATGGVTVALSNQDLAEAQLDLLLVGPDQEEVRQAEVRVEQAQVAIEQAQAAVGQAQAAVTQAEAGVTAAHGNVAEAQKALDRMTLTAVFPSTVADVDVELGELVSPSQPLITLAQLGEWRVETRDLSEQVVGRVEIGAPVAVDFDAIPGEVIEGTVSDIALVSRLESGDVVYLVTVDLEDRPDLPLRWGMTAFVEIEAD